MGWRTTGAFDRGRRLGHLAGAKVDHLSAEPRRAELADHVDDLGDRDRLDRHLVGARGARRPPLERVGGNGGGAHPRASTRSRFVVEPIAAGR